MLRIILIPFFVVFLLGNFSAWSKWMALAIFVIASLTDMLDGYLARRDNLVTNFESSWIHWQTNCWFVLP